MIGSSGSEEVEGMAAHGDEAGMVRIGDYLIERLRALRRRARLRRARRLRPRFHAETGGIPLTLVTTCDEQGAGFAADAYARLRGLGVVCVTYGVGGLKVTNTTGQAYAEESPVLVISGAPSVASGGVTRCSTTRCARTTRNTGCFSI